MLTLELLEITETMVKYKYYPESSKEYGIIMIDRMSEERKVEKEVTGYESNYLGKNSNHVLNIKGEIQNEYRSF